MATTDKREQNGFDGNVMHDNLEEVPRCRYSPHMSHTDVTLCKMVLVLGKTLLSVERVKNAKKNTDGTVRN